VEAETRLASLVAKAQAGDREAVAELISHSIDRLYILTRRMLQTFPRLHRWEETDDVFQNAMIRLQKALEQIQIESLKHFYNLAALQIRRELLEMNRVHFGKFGIGANHKSTNVYQKSIDAELGHPPEELEGWLRFHQAIESLTHDEQEVVNLLYYQGVRQEEAAKILDMPYRTLKRIWHSIRYKLHGVLDENQ